MFHPPNAVGTNDKTQRRDRYQLEIVTTTISSLESGIEDFFTSFLGIASCEEEIYSVDSNQ